MLIGPSAIGKSTLMNKIIQLHPEFGRVTGFTTRSPRPNDEPGQYRYLSKQAARQKVADKRLIQYAISPTTGQIYGSEVDDYPAYYNLLDTLSNVVEELRKLPFKKTIAISLTAPPNQWREWFLSRYPAPSEEAKKRLEEAKLSINWSLNDPDTYWLENSTDQLTNTAQKLIDIVLNRPQRTTSKTPRAMLELIEKGIWT